MSAASAALLAAALGCGVIYRFGRLTALRPPWAVALLVLGGGSAAGAGLTSILFLLCRLAVPSAPRLSLMVEIAFLGWLGYEIWRQPRPAHGSAPASPYTRWLMGALVLAFGIAIVAMSEASRSNPQGNWDAWAIWNLRARFLAAGGDLPQRAWSAALTATHPEYPLLVSGFVARCWTYSGSDTAAAPIAASYLFFTALIATVVGGFAIWRSQALALLLGLTLLGTPTFLHEVVSQYADIPLACYFAGATMFLLLDRPLLAGLFAGLAAWTKDEGALFLLVFLVAAAFTVRGRIWRAAAGAIPGVALAAIVKLALAPKVASFFVQGIAQRAVEPGRLGEVFGAFVNGFAGMRAAWYHPILPAIALAATLRFQRDQPKILLLAGSIPAVMLAGYFCIFMITPFGVKWQAQTSLDRLMAQVWPSLLIAIFAALRAPESLALMKPVARSKRKR